MCSLAREFARRVAFAQLKFARALVLDLAVAGMQLSLLCWLGVSGRMSATNAVFALGMASAISFAGWFYCMRRAIRFEGLRPSCRVTWSLGKWLLLGRVAGQVQTYIVYWIMIGVAGAAVTGVYAACTSIVNIANPLVLAITNVMSPKLVLAWRQGGSTGLRQEAFRNVLLLAVPLLGFSLLLWFAGGHAMFFLYHGDEYQGHRHVLLVLALAMLVAATGTPASRGLAAMERPRAVVAAATFGMAVGAVAVWLLTEKWGLIGAASGMLAGNLSGACARWGFFLWRLPVPSSHDPIVDVLRNFTAFAIPSQWQARRVGYGEQADVFTIEFDDDPSATNKTPSLAIKLYRRNKVTLADVRAQFEALSDLYAALDGFRFNGWRVFVPRPLCICERPLAFVMTAVPGQHLEAYDTRSAHPLTKETIENMAEAFAGAMQHYWADGRRHADLGLRNVLFEIETQTISLIDAGTKDSCQTCSNVVNYPSPSTSDLAHVLRDAVRDITDLVGSSRARIFKELFAEHVIRTSFETVAPLERRQKLDDIIDCLSAHLRECLDMSWSPKGVAHRLVKVVALNRARAIARRVLPVRHLQAAARPVQVVAGE